MEVKAKQFRDSLDSFKKLMEKDLSSPTNEIDEILLDAIKNGMVQKFEVTIELCWKAIKHYLLEEEGLEVKSPKQAIKSFYTVGKIDEDTYLALIQMTNHRNMLSHVYYESEFNAIIAQFPKHIKHLDEIAEKIKALSFELTRVCKSF